MRTPNLLQQDRRNGFTLIELIVVVIVLGILMGIAIPSFLSSTNGAKTAAQRADITLAFKAVRGAAAQSPTGNVSDMGISSAVDAVAIAEPELIGMHAVAIGGTPGALTFTNGAQVGTLTATGLVFASNATTSVPTNTSVPVITVDNTSTSGLTGGPWAGHGTGSHVGSTLTASTGSWSNTPISFAYSWSRCNTTDGCSTITGATAATYVPSDTVDPGYTLLVDVTATNAAGSSDATSAQTAVLVASP